MTTTDYTLRILDRPATRKGWGKYAGHVRVEISHPRAREPLTLTYSAGSAYLINWAHRHRPRGVDLSVLPQSGLRGPSVNGAAALEKIRKLWEPDLGDVLRCLYLDCQGFEPGMSFREWCEEQGMDWDSPADALEAFEAIQRTYRFLTRTAGEDYARSQQEALEA